MKTTRTPRHRRGPRPRRAAVTTLTLTRRPSIKTACWPVLANRGNGSAWRAMMMMIRYLRYEFYPRRECLGTTGTIFYHAQLGLPEKGRQSVCYLMNSTYPTTHLTKANNIHVVVLFVLKLDKFYTKYSVFFLWELFLKQFYPTYSYQNLMINGLFSSFLREIMKQQKNYSFCWKSTVKLKIKNLGDNI